MPDIPIKSFVLPMHLSAPDSHVMRAAQTILAQVRKVKDDASQTIFSLAELVKFTRESIYRADAPYAHLSIMPVNDPMLTGEGTVVYQIVSLQLALIFTAWEGILGETEVQAWANALGVRVMEYLDPKLSDNLNGIDFRNEIGTNGGEIWQWYGARKRELDRKVIQSDGTGNKTTGLRWRYNLTLPIRTWPTTPLV